MHSKYQEDSVEMGKAVYSSLANKCGIDAVDALDNMVAMLSSTWYDDEHFLGNLGRDNELATTEARQHFNLPPFE